MDNPGLRLGDLSLLSPRERQRILVDWNRTEHPFPSSTCLHRLIEEQVERTPDAVAVTFAGRSLTYRELNHRANQVAHRLVRLGVGVEDRVAVSLRRSMEMITGLLGVLKAGAAYVPVDPDYPAERLAFLLADCRPAALLTTSDVEERLPARETRVLRLDADASLGEEPGTDLRTGATAESLVYVIYTSGSTGRPKGAANLHRAVVNRLDWMRRHYDVGPADRILHKTPFSFDVSVWELFLPLLAGARLVLAGPGDHREMSRLVEIIRREEVTMMHFVPSLLEIFVDTEGVEECSSLRAVVASGEALPHALQERFFSRLGAELHNLYGPTEAAVDVTCWHCPRESASRTVPIGRPISNVRIYVLDPGLQPVPVGVSGELHIGGVALARGYLERPDLTAARFVPDPHGGEPGARLYKTGDLARFLPDGNVEFQGRIDHQVKLRGYRIELGEIEAVLTEHRQVRQAVVDLRADAQGHKRLVAWVVLAAGAEQEGDPIRELRRHAAGKLPEYMVPGAFAILESLPLNPSGKVDRKALPEPDLGSRTRDSYVPPSGPVEEDLVRIWGELLPVERIGVRDNFFEIGGDSIISIQVVARARKKGIVLEVNEIFRHPTIAGLAELAASRAGAPPATEIAEAASPAEPMALAGLAAEQLDLLFRDLPGAEDAYPLSPMQAGLLFRSLYLPSSDSYLNQNVVEIRGPVDEELLRRAWTEVVNYYTILRSGFLFDDIPEPLQYVMDRVDLPWTAHDWRHLTTAEREAAFTGLLAEDRKRPFDLARAPLLRVQWMRLAEDHGYLLWSHHHILLDGWCLSLIWGNMFAAYEQLKATGRVSLPPSRPYRDYIEWLQRQDVRSESESFWREYLAGFSRVTGFSTVETHFDGEYDTYVVTLPADRTEELRRLAQRYRVTLNTFVQAVWSLLLARYSRRHDVVFGVSVSGRPVDLAGVEDMVGLFINTLPLRVRIDPGTGLRAFLQDLQANMVGINDHAHVPLARIKSWCEASGGAGKPIFETLIAFENYPEDKLPSGHVADLEVRDLMAMEKTEYPLGMIVLPEDRLIFHLNYDTSHFDRGFVTRLGEQILTLLTAMLAAPEAPIGSFPLLREDQARRFAAEWTGAHAAPAEPVHRAFERRAALHPHRPAVVDAAGAVTTYGELDRRAREIARRIAGTGERIVALLADRSADMVAGLLAVWKAGAACLPLDPTYPEARLRYLLEDSGAAALLAPASHAELAERLPAPVVLLAGGLAAEGPEPSADADPARLAYVMYTSGSTGRPKGVLCTHGGLANRLRWSLESLGATAEDALLHIAAPGFDIALWEILFPLLAGGRLVLADEGRRTDPAYLVERVEAEGVTVLHFVPSLLRLFVDLAPAGSCRSLRRVACGGEGLPEAVRRRFQERFDARLDHWYGPTEAAISITSWECEERTDRAVPIGRPIASSRVYVLDEALRSVPPGLPGEIYLGGVPLARGYLGDPGATADRWVPDPISGEPGARLYRTGDLGRILADGQLAFVGRVDGQLKIRGQRIEPGEIETALLGHGAVAEAVVGSWEPRPGDAQLVAWVRPRDERGAGDPRLAAGLQDHLRQRLPASLVPSSILLLERFPLLPSGKVDRSALPHPATGAAVQPGRVAPRSPVEAELARIWRELLGVEEVGVTDSFFELGGHSLLVISLLHRIDQTFGRGSLLSITDIFKRVTIEDLARVLEGAVDPRPDTLVPLRAEGSQTPLVLIHPSEGIALSYRNLVAHLPDRPLHAINNPHFGDPERAFTSVEEMARCYLGYLRSRFPDGPYCLGGWSFGGVVALEMAAQLVAGGQEVEALVLIDSYNFAGFDLPEPEGGAAELLAGRGIDVGTEEGRKLLFEVDHNGSLAARYRPHPYGGRVILLRAQDRDPDDEMGRDSHNGWRDVFLRKPEVYSIPGRHAEMLDPDRVELVGRSIAEALKGEEVLA
jgi:nocardicin nonribosomal peptide synthetase NocB